MNILPKANVMYLVGVVEVLSGLAFIFNKFDALMAVILMSVSINVVMAHAAFMPIAITSVAVLLLLNIAVIFSYKNKYKSYFVKKMD